MTNADDDAEKYAALAAEMQQADREEGRPVEDYGFGMPQDDPPGEREPAERQQRYTPPSDDQLPDPSEDPVGYFDARISAMEGRAPRVPRHQVPPPQAPSADEDPVGHFSHRMQALENAASATIGDYQQRQLWSHVQASEDAIREDIGEDYDEACKHLESARAAEIARHFPDTARNDALARQRGLHNAAHLRAEQLNVDRRAVAAAALQRGVSPAELYYSLAQQRGYRSRAPVMRASEMRRLAAITDPDAFGREWEKFSARARG